jgi:peptidoglycan hydrolase CwlO-like protein
MSKLKDTMGSLETYDDQMTGCNEKMYEYEKQLKRCDEQINEGNEQI